ncbi:EAL domain-containing protein [Methylosarcina fibrata]|uniref:EAL domain-containing protein n=1 Tax=Methylosarcina fibrata TaxID=105972 RepID=UPI0012FCD09A|nr:EAL domain-containing protein [Methylosarcina fibrata]
MKELLHPRKYGGKKSVIETTIGTSLLHIVITAVLFYIAGKLTLPLSVPPSYATAIWPPAGIALGAALLWGGKVLPGIFMAELMIHYEVYNTPSMVDSPGVLLVFFLNPVNSVARAWLGCILVRKFAAYPHDMVSARLIALFFLMAGPVATFFPAVFSVFGLLYNNVIIREDIVFAFLTWWLGDCTGIAVFTPLFFIIFNRSSPIWRQRSFAVGFPLIVMFLITASAYLFAQQHEVLRLQKIIEDQACNLRKNLENQFRHQLTIMSVYKGLAGITQIKEDNFRTVSLSIIHQLSNAANLIWLEPVDNRPGSRWIKRYSVQEWTGQTSDSSITETVRKVDFGSGTVVVTEQYDFLVLMPVADTRKNGCHCLKGVVAGVFNIGRFVQDSLTGINVNHMAIVLFNNRSENRRLPIFQSHVGQDGANSLALFNRQTVVLGPGQWMLNVTPDNKFLSENYSWSVWQLLAGGMFLTGLTGISLLVLTGHTESVRSEVYKRTEELKLSNSKLVASEEQFRKLVHTQSAIVWRANPLTMQFLFVNDEAENILGYPVRDWLDDPSFCQKHIHPDDFERTRAVCMAETARQNSHQVEFRMYAADGRCVWLRNFIDLTVEHGEVSELYGFMVDITRQKQAEEQLRLAATTFESQQGILITDKNARILRINKSFTEITGYSQEQVEGKTPGILKSGLHDQEFYENFWNQLIQEGRFEGEMWNRRSNGEIYPQWQTINAVRNDSGEVTHYVSVFSDITEKKEAENKIHALAFYDPLTGLPNRRLLLDRFDHELAVAQRNKKFGALLFLDLDHFKWLNDTQGHLVGDQLLIQVAARLSSVLRKEDTPARLGGDEFVVLLPAQSDSPAIAAEHTLTVAEKVREKLNEPFLLDQYQHQLSPSIGIALFPSDQETPAKILQQADIAMYRSKASGRNTISFFHPAMQEEANHRVNLESHIRDSLKKNRFFLYYQPQVRENGTVSGAEALIRWHHPEKGVLTPKDFISVAEESGVILEIGAWVLMEACRQIQSWQAEGIVSPHISINISARQFRQKNFVGQVQEAIENTGISAGLLGIELTESLMIADIEETIAKMKALKELGVAIAIDDFGTGYSSLMYLKQLPIDVLKIDRGFIQDITDNASDAVIVETIISMARHLNLHVIAEGVETFHQMNFLKQKGCRHFQGYYFSEPISSILYAEKYLADSNRPVLSQQDNALN